MLVHCIIIEDQPPAQRVLQKFIAEMETMVLKGVFADALKAIEFINSESVDLIFLDIHLPKISGIDFLKTLHKPPNIILTTAFSEYALESYDYNVVDYLLKPFSFERFVKAVSKIKTKDTLTQKEPKASKMATNKEFIFVKCGYELVKIDIDQIRYIQSDADYTELYTNDKKYLTPEPLRHWEENLDTKTFMRIHRSYIVNTSKIEKIIGNKVRLDQNTSLPIGRAFKENFIRLVTK
ncbi:LytR/AlgR family response regulator transcription factor [Maribacter sp. CXY002]|uniref:LytR/AlgR family response regulator transcription factor n=1 Tax=Maribacter luteocoastalis TaxID=3407671 RepID=UPI003B678B7A